MKKDDKKTLIKMIVFGSIHLSAWSALIQALCSFVDGLAYWEILIPGFVIAVLSVSATVAVIALSAEVSKLRKERSSDTPEMPAE